MDYVSLIKADDTWLLWAVVIAWTAISIFLDKKYKWASMLTACMIALLGAMLLANFRVIPLDSPVYDIIWDYVIPLAVPLLLFNANLKMIVKESGKMFIVFHIAALGTVIGVIVATQIFKNGGIPEIKAISAMFAGTYIGGSVNLAAMKTAFTASSEITSAAVVADNLLMAIYFFVLAIIPGIKFFSEKYKHPVIDLVKEEKRTFQSGTTDVSSKTPMSTVDMAIAVAVAFAIVAVSGKLSGLINASPLPAIVRSLIGQKYLIITTISLILATSFPKFFDSVKGANVIGEFFVTIFFVAIGVPASILMILSNAPLLFVYAAIIVLFNMAISLGVGKLCKFNLEDILVCSNATIGGPTTAAAFASSKRWNELVAPAILVGVWGYVIGNWIAPTMANLMFP
jgi:uncharacterized membrane protein